MHGLEFAARLNTQYFGGRLAPAVIDRLALLPMDRDDTRAFVERMCRSMCAAGSPATDFSVLQAEILAALISRLLPGNWEGRVPPITVAERHIKLDALVGHTAAAEGLSRRFIDVACGFPPLTTLDTATTLSDWEVTGVDRSLPAYLVHDGSGNYAVYDPEGRATYFQPLVPSGESWAALLTDWEGSRRRFEALLVELLAERARAGGGGRIEMNGATLDVDPVSAHSDDRLRFVRADLAQANVPPAGVVRCCNMLLYFDRAFRREALTQLAALLEEDGLLICGTDWVYTTEARYFTFRKRNGHLSDGEFAFSLDNVAPVGIVPWYTLHDDDVEIEMLVDMTRRLRADRGFIGRFMARSDALRADMALMPRGPDGYYVTDLADMSQADLWQRSARHSETLAREFGDAAVGVLRAQGLEARLNAVGHVTIRVPAG
jgi:hypothetical protein